MEKKIKIKNRNRTYINVSFSRNKKTKGLVIFLSGLSGSKNLPLFREASKEFVKKGFSTLRLNFFSDSNNSLKKNKALKPEDLSLSIYIRELKNVVDALAKGYSNIVMVGHSFGAIIFILFLNKYRKYRKNTKLVLWDPTLLPWKKRWMEEDFIFDSKKKIYFGKKTGEIMNETFYKESINIKNTAETLRGLNKKVYIIAAEHGGSKDAKKYFLRIKKERNSSFFIIKKTGHCFESKKAKKELFSKTIQFINQ